MHKQGQTPSVPRRADLCCTCGMQSAAELQTNYTTRHSGSSVPWKMSRLASSQHTAPHLMFPPPPTLSPFVLFSQCGLSFHFFYYIPFFFVSLSVSLFILSILVTFLFACCPNFLSPPKHLAHTTQLQHIHCIACCRYIHIGLAKFFVLKQLVN